MNKKLTQDMCTVTRAAEDAISDCLKEEEPSWEHVFHIPDSSLEREKLYYAKKKTKVENHQYGHNLEAVAGVRSKLLEWDRLVSYIFFKW